MSNIILRTIGTGATVAPNMKRSTMLLSTGQTAVAFPDSNRADSNGYDTTGVPKIYVYLSAPDHAYIWTPAISYTPATLPSANNKSFMGSFVLGADNSIHAVYVGVDNSLRYINWSGYNGVSGWAAPTEQIIQAANAVVSRYRAVDISVNTTGNPAIVAYESINSGGNGGFQLKTFIRRNDGVTWINAFQHNVLTNTEFVPMAGNDVSISFDTGAPVANVAKLALYYTQQSSTRDIGDIFREISFNLATGVAATTNGTWLDLMNKNMAKSQRRGHVFSAAPGRWILAASVGTSAPFFEGIKVQSGVYTGIVRNRIGNPPSGNTQSGRITDPVLANPGGSYWLINRLPIYPDPNWWGIVSATYSDNRLIFAFGGVGDLNPRTARMLMIRWPDIATPAANYMDTYARQLDNGYSSGTTPESGVIGVYAGNNRNNAAGWNNYDFTVVYGDFNDQVSTVPGVRERKMRLVWEDVLPAPSIMQPKNWMSIPSNRPLLQVAFQGSQNYYNVNGKPAWQIARDDAFTVDVRTLRDPSAQYESFSSPEGLTSSSRNINYQMTTSDAPLYSGNWSVRARMEDDMGSVGPWSSTENFSVYHPPVSFPTSPGGGMTLNYGTGDVTFTWRFTDPEVSNTQSAYQIIVEQLDTGAIVTDTGKVVSSATSVVINLSATLVDVPLQWRIRLWDNDDINGAYSDPLLFTVANPPTVAIVAPTQGQVVTTALPVFQWAFSAGGARTQRAFRITVYDDTTEPSEVVAESGWLFSSDASYAFPSQILWNNKTYSVVIQVQDNVGLFSVPQTEVEFRQVVINSGFEVDDSEWLASNSTIAQSTAQAHRGDASLLITCSGSVAPHADSNYFSVMPGQTVHAWGWLKTPIATAVPCGIKVNWFDEALTYISTFGAESVLVADIWTFDEVFATAPAGAVNASINVGFGGTPPAGFELYIDEIQANGTGSDIITFDSDWIEPVEVVPTLAADKFKVTVSWDDALRDPDFVSWRVYRRYMKTSMPDFDVEDSASIWILVYETSEVAETVTFLDYTVPFGKPIDYVIVQLVDRFGSLIESDITSWATITQEGDRYYFIPEVPIGSIISFEARNVVGDSFTGEVESETVHVIMRGRQVQIGDDFGYTGTLQINLRDPATVRQDREFLEYLSSSKNDKVYLKTPFGDVLYVRIGQIQVERVEGGGASDLVNLSVPYMVVFDEVPPVTRTA